MPGKGMTMVVPFATDMVLVVDPDGVITGRARGIMSSSRAYKMRGLEEWVQVVVKDSLSEHSLQQGVIGKFPSPRHRDTAYDWSNRDVWDLY